MEGSGYNRTTRIYNTSCKRISPRRRLFVAMWVLQPAACRAWIVHAFERISSRTMVSVLRCSDLYNVRYDFTSAQPGKAMAMAAAAAAAVAAAVHCACDGGEQLLCHWPTSTLTYVILCLLYSRFRCRRSCLNVHTYRDAATSPSPSSSRRRGGSRSGAFSQIVLGENSRFNFHNLIYRYRRDASDIDNTPGPTSFNGAFGLAKRNLDVPARANRIFLSV